MYKDEEIVKLFGQLPSSMQKAIHDIMESYIERYVHEVTKDKDETVKEVPDNQACRKVENS